ncbi:hypothetical protein EOPP23_13830 [Endozoicomonas sp. OPT23]|uniref:fimbrial biogenesis chaperone n=1 Tax=Endozoicomonas sp. OPT23 TaxID=2072845 RepID=UPI00129AC62D|nr:fimbria/pilus periplasmic chaperone [Endozoicomonas sp. OPT23]MRI34070.1 hypothetical protein [Endozoicomonas sp. OPT23]
MKRVSSLLILLMLLIAQLSLADMSLDRSIVYFDKKGWKRQDVQVSNLSNETMYLQTEVFRVVNPGKKDEAKIPATTPEEMKLMATPHKSSIKAQGMRAVRLFNRENNLKEEKVYRVLFRPVVGPQKNQEQVVKILVAYEILVFVRPTQPIFKVEGTIKDKKLELTNTGNSSVLLRRGQQCITKDNCKSVWKSKRLYRGQTWNVDLAGEGEVKFALFDGHFETSQTVKSVKKAVAQVRDK